MLLAFAVLISVTVSCTKAPSPKEKAITNVNAGTGVLQAAREVIDALKAKDGKRLLRLVHPEQGVRFSPYAYVDVEHDQVFKRNEIKVFWEDRKIYFWGLADGTGDPINLTPSQYYDRFIMDQDFSRPSSISVNNDRAMGNTSNNAASVYPQGSRVEYYVTPTPGQGVPELDWAALRLVFERSSGSWYLIALIHDEWTT